MTSIKFNVILVLVFSIIVGTLSCSKKGDIIIESNRADYKFTTYTIDTLQLKLIFNDVVLTDTLKTPVGVANFSIQFLDTIATFKVLNAQTGELYLDTLLNIKPGSTTISLIQILAGGNLQLPSTPNEPAPAPGNYKVRFQYSQPTNGVAFLDSVACILRLSGTAIDTVVLSQYEFSSFYEAPLGSNYSMKILDPLTGDVIDNVTNSLNSNNGFTDFNTAIVYATGATSYILSRIY